MPTPAPPSPTRSAAPPPPRRALWIHLAEALPPSWGRALTEALARAHPRLSLVVSLDGRARPGASGLVGVRRVAAPAPGRASVRRFFVQERPQILVLAGPGTSLPREVLRRAHAKGIPVLWLPRSSAQPPPGAARLDLVCAPDAASAAALARLGIPPDRLRRIDWRHGGPDVAAICAAARVLLSRDRQALRESERTPNGRWLGRLLDTRLGRRLEAHRAERIDGLEALREALGRPRHLLCLGNGPSSEEAGVARLVADCCFRVNSRWLGRGTHERPDVVFTGNRTSLARVPGALFGFRNVAEERLLVRRWIRRHPATRLRYFTFGRHLDWLDAARWTARPTNGAVMLATAVALRPERLSIAGVDLFAHPDGAYPGDARTPNGYVPVHDRAVELRILCDVLRRFEGEVVVAGPVLPAALAASGRRDVGVLGGREAPLLG